MYWCNFAYVETCERCRFLQYSKICGVRQEKNKRDLLKKERGPLSFFSLGQILQLLQILAYKIIVSSLCESA